MLGFGISKPVAIAGSQVRFGVAFCVIQKWKIGSNNFTNIFPSPLSSPPQQIRRDALIQVTPRTGVKQYTDEEQRLLSTIDLELARQAQGGSLAQLASEGGSIEVLTNQRQTEPAEPVAPAGNVV